MFVLGVARGCGWQHIGAFVNLGALYLCGIPIAATLGFWLKLRGVGLWIGVQAGSFTQTLLLFIITSYTNWEKQVTSLTKSSYSKRAILYTLSFEYSIRYSDEMLS